MTQLVGHQVHLRAPANRTFAFLLRLVTERGRLHEVEEYGRALVFTPCLPGTREARPLRARVSVDDGETILRIEVADGERAPRPADRQAEQAWLRAAIVSVCEHFEDRADPLIQGSLPPQPRASES